MVLQMNAASFAQGGRLVVQPQSFGIVDGQRMARIYPTAEAASVIALMAGGLVKATNGSVFIGAFDPRIQPVQAKKIAALVPYAPLTFEFPSLDRYIEYRAALWGLPIDESVVRARRVCEQLEGIHAAFAYPLAAALMAQPRLLVLDRPQAAYAAQIATVAKYCAIFSSHTSVFAAEQFSASMEGQLETA